MAIVKESKSAPPEALTTRDRDLGALTDCFYVDIPRNITLEDYILTFYTTKLFKAERAILSFVIKKHSIDEDALLLSQNKTDTFSAWTVESRTANQILLRDFKGDTKSWLMVSPSMTEEGAGTRLYFGTVAVAKKASKDGQATVSYLFHLFGGLHRIYSRALLTAVYKRLSKNMADT